METNGDICRGLGGECGRIGAGFYKAWVVMVCGCCVQVLDEIEGDLVLLSFFRKTLASMFVTKCVTETM